MTAPVPRARFEAAMRRHRLAAAAVLWIERALPRELGLVLTLWSIWIAAALGGVWQAVPGGVRVAALVLAVAASVALLARAAWRIGLPTRAACTARLERGGDIRRGLLALAEDMPAGDADDFGTLLWARAQDDAVRSRPRIGRLEWQPDEATRYGLWPLLGIALGLGLLAAKGAAPERLAASLSPYVASLEPARVSVSIDPPAYALAAPRRLVVRGGTSVDAEVLAGSRLTLRLSGIEGDWRLQTPTGGIWPDGGAARAVIGKGGDYSVRIGRRTVATLDVALAPDAPPAVRFDGQPQRTPMGALRIGYRTSDDYGTVALSIDIARGSDVRRVPLVEQVQGGRGHVFADLTSHPFAGQVVNMALVATDGGGQTGRSRPIRIQLPERRFQNPLAREIIAIRKPLLGGTPRPPLVRALARLAATPERFGDDPAVFGALRSATWRLVRDPRRTARESTAETLWDVAVDIEDGGASRAMDELRTAIERLQREMGSGDDKAIAAMTEQLEAAMSEYLRRQIEAALAEGGSPPSDAGAGAVSVDLGFLDQMFGDLKDRLAAGDTKGAAEALANLRQLMETIRFGSGEPDPAAVKRATEAAEAARELRAITERQQSLRDDTVAAMIAESFGRSGSVASGSEQQAELARAAQALGARFKAAGMAPPPTLDAAVKAMQDAAGALDRADAGDAIRAQIRAIEALQQAANAADAAAERLARTAGAGAMRPGAPGSGLDPLGRPGQGFGEGAVKLPDQSEVRRIQAIRKILEERASDPSRSPEERGYYLRLLKRF